MESPFYSTEREKNGYRFRGRLFFEKLDFDAMNDDVPILFTSFTHQQR